MYPWRDNCSYSDRFKARVDSVEDPDEHAAIHEEWITHKDAAEAAYRRVSHARLPVTTRVKNGDADGIGRPPRSHNCSSASLQRFVVTQTLPVLRRILSCFGGVMDADGQQHMSVADTPAGSALCVDAQPRGWKQLTSFADVRTMKLNGVNASFAGS